MNITRFLERVFSLRREEIPLMLCSVGFILTLFASYAILRPLRDTLGIEGGSEELKWLFLATFFATLIGSILAMFLSGIIRRKAYTDAIFAFFTANLGIFYICYFLTPPQSAGFVHFSRVFYVWVSVFNMFVISSAWSLLADVFTRENSKRLFGIIASGASLGSICGALIVSALAKILGAQHLMLLSIALLFCAMWLKRRLIAQSFALLESPQQAQFTELFNRPIGSKNPLHGFWLIIRSKYLLALLGFILLLTSVSTFLYMEQARVILGVFPRGVEGAREARLAAFASIDLIVQSASFFIQIFLTAKIAQYLGLKWLLGALGILIGVGFLALAYLHTLNFNATFATSAFANPLFVAIVIVMSMRRIGEYALIKPGREMLFVPLGSDEKYKVKNFLDTVVYRGGDAISSQVEGALVKSSIGLTLLVGAAISFVWGALGIFLGSKYTKIYAK